MRDVAEGPAVTLCGRQCAANPHLCTVRPTPALNLCLLLGYTKRVKGKHLSVDEKAPKE